MESLRSTPPLPFRDLHYLSNLPVSFCQILNTAFQPTGIAQALPHPRNACITSLRRETRGEASAEVFDRLISEK